MNFWKLFGIGEKITPIPQEKKMILMSVRPTVNRPSMRWGGRNQRNG